MVRWNPGAIIGEVSSKSKRVAHSGQIVTRKPAGVLAFLDAISSTGWHVVSAFSATNPIKTSENMLAARREACSNQAFAASLSCISRMTIVKTSTSYFACASSATTAATFSSVSFQPSS
jgi:hypothetical protein